MCSAGSVKIARDAVVSLPVGGEAEPARASRVDHLSDRLNSVRRTDGLRLVRFLVVSPHRTVKRPRCGRLDDDHGPQLFGCQTGPAVTREEDMACLAAARVCEIETLAIEGIALLQQLGDRSQPILSQLGLLP